MKNLIIQLRKRPRTYSITIIMLIGAAGYIAHLWGYTSIIHEICHAFAYFITGHGVRITWNYTYAWGSGPDWFPALAGPFGMLLLFWFASIFFMAKKRVYASAFCFGHIHSAIIHVANADDIRQAASQMSVSLTGLQSIWYATNAVLISVGWILFAVSVIYYIKHRTILLTNIPKWQYYWRTFEITESTTRQPGGNPRD